MDTNPYKHPEGGMEPLPRRRLGILSRLGWFAAGFVVSWLVWSGIYHFRARPRDVTETWPPELRELFAESEFSQLEWMKEATARKVGQFVVIAPADPNNASAMIGPLPPNHFPQVGFIDEGPDGQVNWLFVWDRGDRNFSIDLTDGKFTSYRYSTGLVDEVIYRDGNMDGQFDFRMFPGDRRTEIMVGGQWRQYEQEGDTRYVDLDGVRTPLKLKDGVWQIVEEAPEDQ